MCRAVLAIAACCAAQLLAQEVTVSRASLWADTVKRGPMTIEVRGLGTFSSKGSSSGSPKPK